MSNSVSTVAPVAPVEGDDLPPATKPRCGVCSACMRRKRPADVAVLFIDDGSEAKQGKPDSNRVFRFRRRVWPPPSAFEEPELTVDADEIPFDPVTGGLPEPSFFEGVPYRYERQHAHKGVGYVVPEHVRLRREQFRETRQRMREQAQEEERAAIAKRAEELDGHLDDIFKRVAERAEWELQNDAPIVGTAKLPIAFDAVTGAPVWQDTEFNKNRKKIYLDFEDYIQIIDYSLHPHDELEHPVLDNPKSPVRFSVDLD
uniref:Restriction endonuclease n=1 Tax=Panagrellus redivivus TaxID=6233 RepID=A0A7E4UQQ6_PANRE